MNISEDKLPGDRDIKRIAFKIAKIIAEEYPDGIRFGDIEAVLNETKEIFRWNGLISFPLLDRIVKGG